jgi:anti-sigma regulatory factor (Ser/Thr protein kinase)
MSVISSHDATRLLHETRMERESDAVGLRARVLSVAERLGFSEHQRHNMALVGGELASNIVKHGGGRGFIQVWAQPGPTLDLFALDYGCGIANVEAAMADGYSTTRTLGKGLGSVVRLSDVCDIYSRVPNSTPMRKWHGSAVLARFFQDKQDRKTPGGGIGMYSRSLADERHNGDRIFIYRDRVCMRWLHADGLGHGVMAQEATAPLGGALLTGESPVGVLRIADAQLQKTRGAVALAGELRYEKATVEIAGVGDLHAHILDLDDPDGKEQLVFAPGILGREHKQPREYRSWFNRRGLVITASDGIRRNWDAGTFPGLFAHDPQLIAYMLGNIMGRLSDDQSLLVASATAIAAAADGTEQ